jgi:hypothetical protein
MKPKRSKLAACLAVGGLCAATVARAELYSRAGGTMVYDSDQNITWLADADYAATRYADDCGRPPLPGGFVDSEGGMDWYTAVQYTEHLKFAGYDAVRHGRAKPEADSPR